MLEKSDAIHSILYSNDSTTSTEDFYEMLPNQTQDFPNIHSLPYSIDDCIEISPSSSEAGTLMTQRSHFISLPTYFEASTSLRFSETYQEHSSKIFSTPATATVLWTMTKSNVPVPISMFQNVNVEKKSQPLKISQKAKIQRKLVPAWDDFAIRKKQKCDENAKSIAKPLSEVSTSLSYIQLKRDIAFHSKSAERNKRIGQHFSVKICKSMFVISVIHILQVLANSF